jgi:peptidyl-prolyl cis-trans isomerase D
MLKIFRDNLKYLSWILWVVIGLFVLFVFVDFGGGLKGRGGVQQEAAARVGSDSISQTEFKRQYRNLENLYRQVYGEQFTPELAKQMRLPLQALDNAVNQKILLAEARRLGLTVSDEEVRDKILAMPAFKDEKGSFIGEQQYSQVLRANQYTTASFETDLRDDILRQKLDDALLANVYVSDQEVESSYRNQVEKAKIRYLQVPRERFLQQAPVPQNELQSYYQAHQASYKLPEQRDVGYLVVSPAQLMAQVVIPDAELQSFYQAHQADYNHEEQVRARHILVQINDQRDDAAARKRAEEAKKKIAGGADFAAVARELSDDSASKASGGDLGYFGHNKMVKEFEEAAFAAPAGKVVGPVKSSFGYHVLEVTDKKPGGQQPFAAVKDQIHMRLAGQKVQELAESKARELASTLRQQKPANAAAVEALAKSNPGVSYAATGKVGTSDPIPGIGPNVPFSTAAFALKKGEVSDVVQVPGGWAILYLKDVFSARTPPLAEVEAQVRQAVARDRAQKALMERLKGARQEISQGKTLDQVAAELGAEVKETPEFGGQGMIPGIGYNPELIKAVQQVQTGQVGDPVADGQGGLLFQVAERKGWDPAAFATAKDQTRSSLLQEKLQRLRASLVEERRRQLGVEYDRETLQSFGLAPGDQS